MSVLPDEELNSRLRAVLDERTFPIPAAPGFGGTGAPGRLLEQLLGVNGGNSDTPDAGRWEIKFHSGKALLTLFHLEGQPKGHLRDLIRQFGWQDERGRRAFRHTIRGTSDLGFFIVNEDDRIVVRHADMAPDASPYWTHDHLISAFAAKLRRLLVVRGSKTGRTVHYDEAHFHTDPQVTRFAAAVERGVVAVDFDARTTDTEALRNHGTKFRVGLENLAELYRVSERFE